MLWQLPNGNLLLKSYEYNILDHCGLFHSKEIRDILQNKILDNIGKFAEIRISEQFNFFDELKNQLSNLIFDPEKEKYLEIDNCIVGEIVTTFGNPQVSTLDDYLYLSSLYLVRENKFVKYFFQSFSIKNFTESLKKR